MDKLTTRQPTQGSPSSALPLTAAVTSCDPQEAPKPLQAPSTDPQTATHPTNAPTGRSPAKRKRGKRAGRQVREQEARAAARKERKLARATAPHRPVLTPPQGLFPASRRAVRDSPHGVVRDSPHGAVRDSPYKSAASPFKRRQRSAPLPVASVCNYSAWEASTSPQVATFTGGHASYDTLRAAFPWARNFRAGVFVLVRPPAVSALTSILLVQQRGGIICDTVYGPTQIPAMWGPTKGCALATEKSALETALRETEEEAGIRLTPSDLQGQFWAVCRSEEDVREVFIFFVAVMSEFPAVKVDGVEIVNHAFFSFIRVLESRDLRVSSPTRIMLEQLAKKFLL